MKTTSGARNLCAPLRSLVDIGEKQMAEIQRITYRSNFLYEAVMQLPCSPEREEARKKLQEVLFWANQAVVTHGVQELYDASVPAREL